MRKLMSILLAASIMFAAVFLNNPIECKAAGPTARDIFYAIGIGWNLGNSLDAHHAKSVKAGEPNLSQETIWGQPKVTKEQIDYVASLGFNAIRVPVTWYNHSYRDEAGTLHVRKEWLARVKEVVNYCLADNLYVFMDTHHDGSLIYAGVSDNEFVQVKADAAALWREIATYFADSDYKLVFESYNEVDNLEKSWQYGTKAAQQVNELNQIFVDTVRSTGGNNADRVLMVPTLLDKNSGDFLTSFVLPKDTVSGRLLVTVHCYSQQYDQAIETIFTGLESFSRKIGTGIIIGEWGSNTKYSPGEFRGVHASNYVARATAHGLKCIYWDNGSNYAIVDRKALTCNNDMVNAIMHPSAYTSSGTEIVCNATNFVYKTIDQTTGAIKADKHWGTILLTTDGSGNVPVPEGSTNLYVQLSRSGSMSTQAIHYIYLFDSAGNLLSKVNKWSGFTEQTVEIPEGCAFVRIGINSAQTATSKKDYEKGFAAGEIVPYLKFR